MKKILLTTTALIATFLSYAQTAETITFENFNLQTDTFDDGRSKAPFQNNFVSGNLSFNNRYDTSFGGYWRTGFAISTKTDSSTAGYTNLYSCIAASGNNNSKTYAVAMPSGIIKKNITTPSVFNKIKIQSIFVNNSTYAYKSMLNGDFFAKKFGGISGNDKDYFLLHFVGFKTDTSTLKVITDTVSFYLADFRFDDNNKDYIVRNWTSVNLSSLGFIDSLGFYMTSSDTGQFGINTPLFFCVDDIFVEYDNLSGNVIKWSTIQSKIFPNPVNNLLYVQTNENLNTATINDLSGKTFNCYFSNNYIDVSQLAEGIYILTLQTNNGKAVHKFVKTSK
ncbi:MAG: DUF4465 domain-containing protein [Bacteroidia bacterium]